MKAVVQRVKQASVTVDGTVISAIGTGLLILLGVHQGDSADQIAALAKKIAALRIFTDAEDKMNLSVADIGGEILVVSSSPFAPTRKKATVRRLSKPRSRKSPRL